MKRALICGVSGQDGAYLAKLLLDKGYEVVGTSRDAQIARFENLSRFGIIDRVNFESMSMGDFRSVFQVVRKWIPRELYNLSGQSSVALSFEQPVETFNSIVNGSVNLLEAIRFTGEPIRYYNASSSECFGNVEGGFADESTPFRPRSPYVAAKAAAHWQVANYREGYKLFTCNGILSTTNRPCPAASGYTFLPTKSFTSPRLTGTTSSGTSRDAAVTGPAARSGRAAASLRQM